MCCVLMHAVSDQQHCSFALRLAHLESFLPRNCLAKFSVQCHQSHMLSLELVVNSSSIDTKVN